MTRRQRLLPLQDDGGAEWKGEKKAKNLKSARFKKIISLFHSFITRIACLDFIFILKYKNMVYYP
jgi:type IV secretory pathway component VirB8